MHCHDNQSMFSCKSKFNSLANIASHNKLFRDLITDTKDYKHIEILVKKKNRRGLFTQQVSWNVQNRD